MMQSQNPPFVRSAYNYDTDQASESSGLVCLDPSMTQQQFREECDINVIIRRFGITGQLPQGAHMPEYGDFSQVIDFHTAQNAIRAAHDTFMLLPATVRERFKNDPQELLLFCENPANLEEARALGLAKTAPPDLSGTPKPNPPTPN